MLSDTNLFGSPTKTASAIQHLELRQPRSDGIGRGLAETADRSVPHRLRDVAQQHDVGAPVAVALSEHPLEDLFLPLRPHAAGRALSPGPAAENPSYPSTT